MTANAEPGIQNIDIARKYSNSDAVYDPTDEYDSRILSTNACSEQYLSRESLCVLASINVGKFSTKREIFIGQLEKVGTSVNRFLDNVNKCELVYQTYFGIKTFFEKDFSENQKQTTLLPYFWNSEIEDNQKNRLDVFALQVLLRLHEMYPPSNNYKDCPLTGSFGKCTENALKNFQDKYSLENVNQKRVKLYKYLINKEEYV